MEQTQITQQILCPEFHNILWQKQNTPTNCVPTAMRMILRARGGLVNPPDAGPQGVREDRGGGHGHVRRVQDRGRQPVHGECAKGGSGRLRR